MYTLVEYITHRWFFHVIEYFPMTKDKIYYVVHGAHHVHPNKGVNLPLINHWGVAFIWSTIIYGIFGSTYWAVVASGVKAGYAFFEFAHFYAHSKLKWSLLEPLREYHDQHHVVSRKTAFGFVSPFWDLAFGSLPPKTPYNLKQYDHPYIAAFFLYLPIPAPYYHFIIQAIMRSNK